MFEEQDSKVIGKPPRDGAGSPYKPAARGQAAPGTESRPAPHKWKMHTVAELCQFRDEITATLPAIELSKLNLENETLLQFHVIRELQADVFSDQDVPANQRAQVANAVASSLKALADMQVALYSSERYKDIENLMIRTLDMLPEAQAETFLIEYARLLRKHT